MPAAKSSLVHPRYKTEYRVRKWPKYERGLRSRGDVTIWFSEKAIANWISRSTGRRGEQRRTVSGGGVVAHAVDAAHALADDALGA